MIRKILLRVEAAEGIISVSQLDNLADLRTVARHVEWLAEAGLLKVEHLIPDALDAAIDAVILRQTWQACEFLDAARDDRVWETILAKVHTHASSISFDLLFSLLKQAGKQHTHVSCGNNDTLCLPQADMPFQLTQ